MKLKYAVYLLAFAYCVDFFSGWAKILHKSYADLAITVAAVLKIFAVIFLAVKLVTNPKLKEIFDQ